jgi:hypothetical protein
MKGRAFTGGRGKISKCFIFAALTCRNKLFGAGAVDPLPPNRCHESITTAICHSISSNSVTTDTGTTLRLVQEVHLATRLINVLMRPGRRQGVHF